jgi:hypothetical protein
MCDDGKLTGVGMSYVFPLFESLWSAQPPRSPSAFCGMTVAGTKVDVAIMRVRGVSPATVPRRLTLARLHGRVSFSEEVKYRLALLAGGVYEPRLAPQDLTLRRAF